MSLTGKTNAEKIWNYLFKELKNPYGVAGIMGNIKAESNLIPNNLQNTYEKKLGMTDESYTKAVDDGSYNNFVKDSAGYGLVQWTYWSLKQDLLEYVQKAKKSIGDLEIQLEFLCKQLQSPEFKKNVWDVCSEAKSVRTASDAMLLKFERPADQSEKVQELRASYGQTFFDQYADVKEDKSESAGETIATFIPRMTRPTAGNKYYIRKASGGWSNAIQGSPTDSQCDVLSNCVGYAYGRFNEIGNYGSCKFLSPVNAENFMEYAPGLATGKTPELGACMVWQKGATLKDSDGAGHVAIVEKIISDTEIVTSESGWGSSTPFWTQTRKKGDGNWGQSSAYTFRGFIYNPAVSDKTKPGKTPEEELKPTPADVVLKYAKGDIVNFTGKTHYTNSYKSGSAKECKPGEAQVTAINKTGAHPYHLKATSNSKSTVNGWVDAADVSDKIVKIPEDIKPTTPVVVPVKNTMKYTEANPPLVCMMTNSTCYLQTRTMTPKGVLWHSTGANNPNLKRYVQPSKSDKNYADLMKKLGTNSYGNDWNHVSVQAGLNCWIGKLADGTVTTVQTMPWNYRPWGCASGSKGSCNDYWIQFEICEDDLKSKDYFEQVYKEACELTAYLCTKYKLDPKGKVNYNGVSVPVILCHQDSYQLNLGSNHADVYHWFKKYGKTMEDVRNDVATIMAKGSGEPLPVTPTEPVIVDPSYQDIKVGDIITLASNATYTSGKSIPNWVFKSTLYAREIRKDSIVFSILRTGDITGVVSKSFVTKKADGEPVFKPYLVIVTADVLNVRSGPGTSYKINTTVKKNEVYTIVEEQGKWGKLKSGAGWISLDYTKKK